MKLGFQISSLRPCLRTPEEVEESVARLTAMGWREMQIQWIDPAVPDEAAAEIFARHGVRVIGVQDKTGAVFQNLERMLAQNRLWGGELLTVSGIPAENFLPDGLAAFAEQLRALAARLAGEGMRLSFHPVWTDFAPAEGLPAALRLLDALPEMELTLCVYHAVKAGLDPCALLRRYAGRVSVVHLKNSAVLPDGREVLMPVGQGNIDWPPILAACRETGVRFVLAEQERWEKDPFLCMEESFTYLTGLGLVP